MINTKHVDIRKLFTAFACCYFFTVCVSFAAENEPANRPIADLQQKVFRVTTINGEQSISLISGYSGEPWTQKWWIEGYGRPCTDNVARLSRAETATAITGTNHILAFLDCPAANDGNAASIVSLFDGANTDTPICFSRVDLMDKPNYYYYGMVNSVDVRRQQDDTLFVVATIAGGDAGDSWVGYVLLHMNGTCNLTLLSKFYASMSYYTDSGNCEGERYAYRFVDDTTIEIKKNKILCANDRERSIPLVTKRFTVQGLLRNPTLRVFEP